MKSAITSDDLHHYADETLARPASSGLRGAFAGLIESFRRNAADRRMRDMLSDMDDVMLRDIGIADDEIHRIRARERFTPRAWANRQTGERRVTSA